MPVTIQASEEKEREGERALAVAEQEDEEPSDWEISVHFGRALINDAWSDALGKRARHETTLMNLFTKTLEIRFISSAPNQSWDERNGVVIEAASLAPPKH
jgi:hypothetical protein